MSRRTNLISQRGRDAGLQKHFLDWRPRVTALVAAVRGVRGDRTGSVVGPRAVQMGYFPEGRRRAGVDVGKCARSHTWCLLFPSPPSTEGVLHLRLLNIAQCLWRTPRGADLSGLARSNARRPAVAVTQSASPPGATSRFGLCDFCPRRPPPERHAARGHETTQSTRAVDLEALGPASVRRRSGATLGSASYLPNLADRSDSSAADNSSASACVRLPKNVWCQMQLPA